MDSHLSNLLRRSRQPHQRAAANLNISIEKKAIEDKNLEALLEKRLTPEQLSAIQASERNAATRTSVPTSAAATRNPATPATAATQAVGGVASRIQSSPVPTPSSAAPVTSSAAPTRAAVPSTSSAVPVISSSSSSTSVRPSSSSTTIRSTSSSTTTSSSSTRPNVLTVTSSRALPSSSSASSSATLPTASAAAASQSSETTGLGTGAIVGIALAILVGLVILGSCVGWVYRKSAQRKYNNVKAPWSKLDDHHDVTPFPPGDNEKPYLSPDEDIYGHSPAPVIGSRRALALARQNGFHADGSMRPDSDYMIQRDGNSAGYGAGHGLGAQYGAYPAMGGHDYGQPTQDYAQPASPGYDYDPNQTGMAISAPGNTRQLVGPNGAPYGYSVPGPTPLAPVALGRPLPPQSAAEFADREEFMDLPNPTPTGGSSGAHMSQYSTYGLAYAESEPDYMPHTATTTGWAGDAKIPHSAIGQHTPLPAIEPASPLMSSFDFQKRQSQSLGPIASNFASKYGANNGTAPMYQDEDDASRQKRMYGEVASAAGVQEPATPHTADLSSSTNSYETASSFSAHQPELRSISHRLPPMPQLPVVNLIPPQPYQHGRPLSPLTEVETPRSVALTSSSALHGQEVNPFEEALPPPSALRYPHSAVSSTGATAFPSPSFPPPSPGGMSVPGSVSDSPRGKRESMFDGDDAYGGI